MEIGKFKMKSSSYPDCLTFKLVEYNTDNYEIRPYDALQALISPYTALSPIGSHCVPIGLNAFGMSFLLFISLL